MPSRAMLAACLLWVLPAAVYAQQFNPRARNQPKRPAMERFAADGTIEMVAPGRILMLSASNQKWMIWLHREAEISVTGTAEADFLKAGHFIEFTATLDKRGNVKEKIAELTITTPSQTHPLGVWPGALAPDGADHFGAGNAPGVAARLRRPQRQTSTQSMAGSPGAARAGLPWAHRGARSRSSWRRNRTSR